MKLKRPLFIRRAVLVFVSVVLIASGYRMFVAMNESSILPKGVACVDKFLSEQSSGYVDPSYNLPSFTVNHLSYFKCESTDIYSQYEIRGTDTTGHMFTVIRGSGGRAASGADGYFDYCYIEDGKVIKSEKLLGRDNHVASTCTYTTGFPVDPTSSYTYIK